MFVKMSDLHWIATLSIGNISNLIKDLTLICKNINLANVYL